MPNERILIVDDEQDVVNLLRYNLDKAQYKTMSAGTGEEALEMIQKHAPDLVLLDIMLPSLSGWDVCKILKENSQGKSLPIIMLSALTDEESRLRGLSIGASDYLCKPFSLKELLLKIRKCIDQQITITSLQSREREHDTSLQYLVHELKNSLSIIGNFSAVALKNDAYAAKYLKTINIASLHAESLLNDVSMLAQLEKDGGSMPLVPISLVTVTKEVADMFCDAATKNETQIVFVNENASQISGQRTAVRQVLINLISNAIKYNRCGGKVWISFNESASWQHLSVRDEGCGVSPTELPNIFDKFYRAAGSEQRKGAGLGLYIVNLLMEAMGGKIEVISCVNVGSTFTASFKKHDIFIGNS